MLEQNKAEELTEKVKEYVNIQVELIKLKATDKLSLFSADMALGIILALLAFLVIIFISFAAGFYLASVTGSNFAGFIIVGGIYLAAAIIITIYRKKLIIDPVRNRIIKQMLSDEQHDK